MSKADDYRRRAAECLRLARTASDKTNRALLLEMAETWIALADQDRAKGTPRFEDWHKLLNGTQHP